MSIDFSSARNQNERAVYTAVQAHAEHHPGIGHDEELLADVACVALNRLPPHDVRRRVDCVFYLSETEREASNQALAEAVDDALGFVQARTAMRARG